ncbi:glycosyltransferase family 4 protein [Wukongibacter sp. M2B1]|uniref:glycosyltransferase family 4 protein n=1 Tax=Wukongibacter sp. M2B1 TaxID=3088895 RepID=UPI003D7A95C2
MIVQVGPYPPPHGGISVYIKRMKEYLDLMKIDNEVWNVSSRRTFFSEKSTNIRNINLKYVPLYYLFSNETKIIHYSISGKKTKYFIGVFNRTIFRKRRKILTIHGDCVYLYNNNDKIMTRCLNSFDVIICVKHGDKEFLENKGITSEIFEIPAYINPIEKEQDRKNIPREVWSFIDKSKFVITANGCIRFYKEKDLYGIDMLIDLVYRLKKRNMDVNLLIALLGVEDQTKEEKSYYKELKDRISNLDLKDKVFIFEVKGTEFYPILQKSNLFIRPTNTDGDAVSLREALHFKAPSIASDVVVRPEGTILFQNRNKCDLEIKVVDVLKNYDYYKKIAGEIKIKDYAVDVSNIYEKLLCR